MSSTELRVCLQVEECACVLYGSTPTQVVTGGHQGRLHRGDGIEIKLRLMIGKLSGGYWKDRAGHFGHGWLPEQICRTGEAKLCSGHGDEASPAFPSVFKGTHPSV